MDETTTYQELFDASLKASPREDIQNAIRALRELEKRPYKPFRITLPSFLKSKFDASERRFIDWID